MKKKKLKKLMTWMIPIQYSNRNLNKRNREPPVSYIIHMRRIMRWPWIFFLMNEQKYFKSIRPKPEQREQNSPLAERVNENTFHFDMFWSMSSLSAILCNPKLFLLFRNRMNIDYSRSKLNLLIFLFERNSTRRQRISNRQLFFFLISTNATYWEVPNRN